MNFTHNNHLKYWINDDLYGFRKEPTDRYRVEVGSVDPVHYKQSDWYKEQLRTADAIRTDFGRDFVVMFSGGTDSEIVLRAFVEIGVKPRCVFLKFPMNLNQGDMLTALEVCNELGLKLEIVEHNLIDFYFSGEAAEFASTIQCRQIAYLNVYHNIKKLGVPAIMGGEMLVRKQVFRDKGPEWYYVIRENEDASAMRFSLRYGIPLVNEWFSYTPEMMAYYLEHPDINKLLTGNNYKLSTVTSKNKILRKLMPSLLPKRKTHGFEKLLGFNGETYETLYNTHPHRLEPSLDGILLTDLNKMLYRNLNENS